MPFITHSDIILGLLFSLYPGNSFARSTEHGFLMSPIGGDGTWKPITDEMKRRVAEAERGDMTTPPAVLRRSRIETLRADDYPGDANRGIVCAGLSHLERDGFQEGDQVKVMISIEKLKEGA